MIIKKEVLDKVSKETVTRYDEVLVKKEEYYYIPEENIEPMLEDLLFEIEHWKEKYEDLQDNLRDNYKHIPIEEQI